MKITFAADIEDAEIALLKGCQNVLSDTENPKIILSAYHKQDDAGNNYNY